MSSRLMHCWKQVTLVWLKIKFIWHGFWVIFGFPRRTKSETDLICIEELYLVNWRSTMFTPWQKNPYSLAWVCACSTFGFEDVPLTQSKMLYIAFWTVPDPVFSCPNLVFHWSVFTEESSVVRLTVASAWGQQLPASSLRAKLSHSWEHCYPLIHEEGGDT